MSAGGKISRRKLARFVADGMQSGDGDDVLQKAAAYLIESKQTRSVDVLVRDIEEVLMEDGVVVADIISARPLSAEDKKTVAALLGATQLHARETNDPSVLGGVRVETTGRRFDGTLKHKIDSLKEIDSRRGTA